MLSYRHAFHAGNHADVLKHLVLVQMLQYLTQKPAPFWYIDTHAGAGRYELESEQAQKVGEFRDGIGRLYGRADLPPSLDEYVKRVATLNNGKAMKRYPGSPWFADQMLREEDRLRLFELHSSEIKLLAANFKNGGRRVTVAAADGFAGLKALLPPPPRRALVLIDPSYETKADYAAVMTALADALKRFATGTYAVWYPRLARSEARQLPDKLKALPGKSWLHAALTVQKPTKDGFGMHGSGMFVINPPWTLNATLQSALPWLATALAKDDGAGYVLEQSSTP